MAFVNKTYKDAYNLLVEARNYVAYRQGQEQMDMPVYQRLRISYETMRVTARLTQVMAWLLIQKAVEAGEVSAADPVLKDHKLSGGHICTEDVGAEDEELPMGLRSLLDRSHKLYQRVERLDGLVQQQLEQIAMQQ
ncbi:MAG: DUF1465 family protein [Alphaproteobacteria bacterium]